jgi:GNAT superfamily N-acetyltransferase
VQDHVALEAASQFWAASLGVDEEQLEVDQTLVVPNPSSLPVRAVIILQRRQSCVLSILHPEPSKVIDSVMEVGRSVSPSELLKAGAWTSLAASCTPPATVFISAADRVPPLPSKGARALSGSEDHLRLGRMMDRAQMEEWDRGGVDAKSDFLAGIFDSEDLVAAGSMDRASDRLVQVRIFVAASHRRRGLGSSLLSFLASRAASTFHALQMTVVQGDQAGEGLALSLGFFPFGLTSTVILRN